MCRSPFFKGGSINGSYLARLTGINDRIAEGVSQIYLLQNDIDGRPMSFGNSFLRRCAPIVATLRRRPSRFEALMHDLCQDFGHGSSRNYAAMGSPSSACLVRSKNESMACAGTW